jgi:hypothetical protein
LKERTKKRLPLAAARKWPAGTPVLDAFAKVFASFFKKKFFLH